MEIIKEEIISNAEALEILSKAEKEKKELNFLQKKSLEILKKFKKISAEKAKKMFEELTKIEKLRTSHIVSIINLMPEDLDDLRVALHKDYNLLDENEKNKILEIVKKFA